MLWYHFEFNIKFPCIQCQICMDAQNLLLSTFLLNTEWYQSCLICLTSFYYVIWSGQTGIHIDHVNQIYMPDTFTHITDIQSIYCMHMFSTCLAKGGYVFDSIGLSLCLSVSAQHYPKRYERIAIKVVDESKIIHLGTDWILLAIWVFWDERKTP